MKRGPREPVASSAADHIAAMSEALYDAQEYLIAGLENQAEWWEHLGDAHRDYAKLAQLAVAQDEELRRLRGFPRDMVAWEDVEIGLRGVLSPAWAFDAARCLKALDWIVVRDA